MAGRSTISCSFFFIIMISWNMDFIEFQSKKAAGDAPGCREAENAEQL